MITGHLIVLQFTVDLERVYLTSHIFILKCIGDSSWYSLFLGADNKVL